MMRAAILILFMLVHGIASAVYIPIIVLPAVKQPPAPVRHAEPRPRVAPVNEGKSPVQPAENK